MTMGGEIKPRMPGPSRPLSRSIKFVVLFEKHELFADSLHYTSTQLEHFRLCLQHSGGVLQTDRWLHVQIDDVPRWGSLRSQQYQFLVCSVKQSQDFPIRRQTLVVFSETSTKLLSTAGKLLRRRESGIASRGGSLIMSRDATPAKLLFKVEELRAL